MYGILCHEMARDREAFVRLANARVNKALESIRLIGNLSNRSNYSYTEEDADRIINALRTAVTDCKRRFDIAGRSEIEEGFRLD